MKVSVLIPTYNRSTLACKTVESALAQSFDDYEVIVIDDGSTDDTPEKMAKFGDRIRYIRQTNGGVNNARNHGLRIARGEYIATLDNDDLWLPDKLAIQARILDQFPDVSYTFSNFTTYKSSRDILKDGLQRWFSSPQDWDQFYLKSITMQQLNLDDTINCPADSKLYFGDLYHPSLSHYYVLPSTALFRKSMIPEDVRFVEHDPICGDWDFFARMSQHHPVAYLDYETTHNRSHMEEYRLTRTKWTKQLEFRVDMVERLYMKDHRFYNQNKSEVDGIYLGYLRSLCLQYLLDSDLKKARASLDKYRSHCHLFNIPYLAMRIASYTPGISSTLRSIRSLRG